GVTLRALATRGSIGDAASIKHELGLTSEESVGSRIGGWYVEGGYDITRNAMTLTPYARYESLDTQRRVPSGFLRNPANDQSILTLGVAFKPIPQTVLKVDWQNVENEA